MGCNAANLVFWYCMHNCALHKQHIYEKLEVWTAQNPHALSNQLETLISQCRWGGDRPSQTWPRGYQCVGVSIGRCVKYDNESYFLLLVCDWIAETLGHFLNPWVSDAHSIEKEFFESTYDCNQSVFTRNFLSPWFWVSCWIYIKLSTHKYFVTARLRKVLM
jgi:hypothetical protein